MGMYKARSGYFSGSGILLFGVKPCSAVLLMKMLILALFQETTAMCTPCLCWPSFTSPSVLYCYGWEIFEYPGLSPLITTRLEVIYIYSTNIRCLPALESREQYGALKQFTEANNEQWQCNCLEHWHRTLGSEVNFTTSCNLSISTPPLTSFTPALTSRNMTSYTEPIAPSSFYVTTPLYNFTSEKFSTTSVINFTSSTLPSTDDNQPGYIAAAAAAGGILFTATIVAVVVYFNCPCKRLCRRAWRLRRLRRSTRPICHANQILQLAEINYHEDEACSEV